MAKKRKPTAESVKRSLERLQSDFKGLKHVEKELKRVKSNLKEFLNQVKVISGGEYLVERKKKILRKMIRRR